MTGNSTPTTAPGSFRTTQWTRVLQSRGDSEASRAALSELCAAYYTPVFTFIRSETRDAEKAGDLTQEFFARLLKRDPFAKLDPARGRFRSYLLGAVKHFLSDIRRYESAASRNPGSPLESIHPDTTSTAIAPQFADPNAITPDIEFDRKWALTVIDRALTQLAEEHKTENKGHHFETLKPWLTGDLEGHTQSAAAATLGLSDSNIKVAIHRLRRRFRDHVKQQIAATLPEPDHALVTDELSYLLSILS